MDPYMAEIRIYACNYPPVGWLFCNGQILPIQQYTALFSLLGTNYGGNGTTNFALPNLQGLAVLAAGQGPGLTERDLGEQGGSATVTLLSSQMPAHSHSLSADILDTADQTAPSPTRILAAANNASPYEPAATAPTPMAVESLTMVGGADPHSNVQPVQALNYCIAINGVFPVRS
jgi:microcystin-dependent protein